jgi:uncharacterized protein YjbI with pentapeptide repeats
MTNTQKRLRRLIRKPWLWVAVFLGIFFIWITWQTYRQGNLGFDAKTYWDWMELFLVPAVLAVAGLWFSRVQKQTDLAVALECQRQSILDQYLDKMTQLILENGLGPDAQPEVKRLARTRTLIAMRTLDAGRNRQVVQFLRESELFGTDPVIDLSQAELSGADLAGAQLSGVKLTQLSLKQADLQYAYLSGANLAHADLSAANLRGAFLTGADLTGANLTRADLTQADLGGANLTGTTLYQAKVSASQLARIGHATDTARSKH